jgi:hypothetical protein
MQFSLFVLDIKRCGVRLMGTFASAIMYLFIFHVDPILIESVVPERAAFIVCLVITLTVRAVAPVGTRLAFRSGWDRGFAGGVTLAAPCKFAMGVLVMGFAAPWAYWCLFGAMFIGIFFFFF